MTGDDRRHSRSNGGVMPHQRAGRARSHTQ